MNQTLPDGRSKERVGKEHKWRGSSMSDKVGSLGMYPVESVCVYLRKGEGKFPS